MDYFIHRDHADDHDYPKGTGGFRMDGDGRGEGWREYGDGCGDGVGGGDFSNIDSINDQQLMYIMWMQGVV